MKKASLTSQNSSKESASYWSKQLQMPLTQLEFVVFDLETTGGNPEKSGITEVYGTHFVRGDKTLSFHSMVNPGRKIPPIVRKLTNITDDMVRDAPKAQEILPDFFEFIQGKVLVSHNTQSDLKFLDYYYRQFTGKPLPNFFLCTHILSEKLIPESKEKSLTGLSKFLGFNVSPNHRATEDTDCTVELLKCLLGKLEKKSVATLEEAINLQGDLFSAIKMGWKVPKENLKLIPFSLGLINFYDEKDKLIFSISSNRARPFLKKLMDFPSLPKGLTRLLLKSYRVSFTRQANLLEARLEETKIYAKKRFSFHPHKLFKPYTRGLLITKNQDGSYRVAVSHIKAKALHFYGSFIDDKTARGFLDLVAQKFFGLSTTKDYFIVNENDYRFLYNLLENNLSASVLDMVKRHWLKGQISQGIRSFKSLNLLKHLIQERGLYDQLQGSGILFIPHAFVKGFWDVYTVIGGVLDARLTIKQNYVTWVFTEQGTQFIQNFLLKDFKSITGKNFGEKQAELMDAVLWFFDRVLVKGSCKGAAYIKSDEITQWKKELS